MLQELQSVVAKKISTTAFSLLDIFSYSKASLQYYWEFYLVRQLHFEIVKAKTNLRAENIPIQK